MKLYLAYETTFGLLDSSETCLGVFSSEDKAWTELGKAYNFDKSTWNKTNTARVYVYDGELTYSWSVREVTLDKGL